MPTKMEKKSRDLAPNREESRAWKEQREQKIIKYPGITQREAETCDEEEEAEGKSRSFIHSVHSLSP